MTLILALAAGSHVLQVSDRQLTRIHPITKVRSSVKEPATKCVVFENRAIFGYTGLSILERSRADLWIADTISVVQNGDVMQAIKQVRTGLERAFRPAMVPNDIPYQAVLVSGFRATDENRMQAFNALIANSRDERLPTRHFHIEIFPVPHGQMALTQAPTN